jgi:DNA-binding NtrC family response regulator
MTQENKPSSILLVDDEADIVDVFKQALQQYSFDVSGYTDPLQALKHFRNYPNHYFLVISDIRMPEMNGFEFVKIVKEIKPEVKVFLMTAFEINQAEFRRVLASINIEELIQKPITLKKLYWLVRKYVY